MGELERLLESIRSRNAKTVGLQFPVGLRPRAVDLARELEQKAGVTVLVSAEPSFGACDVAEMPVDLIVHLGHAPMPHLRYRNVFFYDLPEPLPPLAFLDAAVPLLRGRVGLLTTVQQRAWLPAIAEHLRASGLDPVVGDPDRRLTYPGQLLGCDFYTATAIADRVDGYLYIGTGTFHPLGVAMAVDKPVVMVDPSTGEASTLEEVKERILRQRWAAIARAMDARRFGIIVSRKIGQDRSEMASYLKGMAERKGREAVIFHMDLVSPDHLEGYRVDAWVSTACPRIAVEDVLRYKQPILTPQEFEVVLGERRAEDYVLDEIRA